MAASTSGAEYEARSLEVQGLVKDWRTREQKFSSLSGYKGITVSVNSQDPSKGQLSFSLSEEHAVSDFEEGGTFEIRWARRNDCSGKNVPTSIILSKNFEHEIFLFFQSILESEKVSWFVFTPISFVDTSTLQSSKTILQKKVIGFILPIEHVASVLKQLYVLQIRREIPLLEHVHGKSGHGSFTLRRASEEQQLMEWRQKRLKSILPPKELGTDFREQDFQGGLYFSGRKSIDKVGGSELHDPEPWVELFLAIEESTILQHGQPPMVSQLSWGWKQHSPSADPLGVLTFENFSEEHKNRFVTQISRDLDASISGTMASAPIMSLPTYITKGMWIILPCEKLPVFLNWLDVSINFQGVISEEKLVAQWQSSMGEKLGAVVERRYINNIHQGLYLLPDPTEEKAGYVSLLIAGHEKVTLRGMEGQPPIVSEITWEGEIAEDLWDTDTTTRKINSTTLEWERNDFFRQLGFELFSPQESEIEIDTPTSKTKATIIAGVRIHQASLKEALGKLKVSTNVPTVKAIPVPNAPDPEILHRLIHSTQNAISKNPHSPNLRHGFGKMSLFNRSLDGSAMGDEPQRGYEEGNWGGLKIYLQFALLEVFDVQRKLFLTGKYDKLSLYRRSNKRTITGYVLQILFGVQDFWSFEWIKDGKLTLQGAQFLLWFVFLGWLFSPLMNTVKFFTELPLKLLAELFCWLKDSLREGLGQGAYHRLGNWKALYFVLRAFQLLLSGLHLLVRMVVSPVESAEAAYKAGYTAAWLNEILCLVSIVGSVSAWLALIVGAAPALMALFPQLGSALAPLSHTGLANFAAPVMNFLTTHLGFVASSALMGVVTATTTFFFFLGLHEVRKVLDMGIKPLFPAEKVGYSELPESLPQFTS